MKPTKHPIKTKTPPKKSLLKNLSSPLMKKRPGFTLIELMVTMAIIAVLATAGVLAYTDYMKRSRDSSRGEMVRNLNSSVMAYAASNGGIPPSDATAFNEFLSSAGETFGGGSISVDDGVLLKDPVGGRNVCLDADGNATEPCAFHYTAYDDGTYALSYGVEHESSTEKNFYKTTDSVAAMTETTQQNPGSQVTMPKYGVYIGSAKFIGQPATAINGTANDGVDETYTPPGSNTPTPLVVSFRSIRVDAPSGGGGGNVTCDPACTNGNTCTNLACVCGSGAACTGNDTCLNNTSCIPQDPCEQPGATAGTVCSDGTVYVTSTLRTTVSDAGGLKWHVECSGIENNPLNCVETGAISMINGEENTAIIIGFVGTYTAAESCSALITYGHDDWYLPARNELNELYNNRGNIGNFQTSWYWSSTEDDAIDVWAQNFTSGMQMALIKPASPNVRCVRSN